MREAQATTPLYVRIEHRLDTAMRDAIRASPEKYCSISEFVRVAVENQLKIERRNAGRKGSKTVVCDSLVTFRTHPNFETIRSSKTQKE